jgi:hypothetical protein
VLVAIPHPDDWKDKKGSGFFFGSVPERRIDGGSQVTAISSVMQSLCFLCAYFRIFKKIIYYSIFLLDLVIVY